jgi:hypothetical protein
MDHRRECPVPEVGLGTSYQAGPNAFALRVRGDIDASKVLASPTGASNDESIGLGDEQLPILDHGAEFVDVKAVDELDDFSRRVARSGSCVCAAARGAFTGPARGSIVAKPIVEA